MGEFNYTLSRKRYKPTPNKPLKSGDLTFGHLVGLVVIPLVINGLVTRHVSCLEDKNKHLQIRVYPRYRLLIDGLRTLSEIPVTQVPFIRGS